MLRNTIYVTPQGAFNISILLILIVQALFSLVSPSVVSASEPLSASQNTKKCNNNHAARCNSGKNGDLLLNVPSPDWRDQIIYFVMIDRFADGNPGNNDQGAGEYAPRLESHYSGGDLEGISQKLDYIQSLGATAVWITPPVANQWWDPLVTYGGYHGYWARDFSNVDEHYGSLDDYKQLSHNLHGRGMYLIQDIVVNHVGNFFGYKNVGAEYNPSDSAYGAWLNEGSVPTVRPVQPPFDLNDPNNPAHREAAIYHWTPSISDVLEKKQELTYQTSGLDDINTDNPKVVAAFKQIYSKWIKDIGVDAYRIDTAKYVKPCFYEEFLHGPGGVISAAKTTGRSDFLTLGEIYVMSDALSDDGERVMMPYLDDADKQRIKAPLGFPLYKEIESVFMRGRPTRHLSHRLQSQMTLYPHPHLAANFIDNHDVDRFLSRGDEESFRQAYILMMTIPGIPVIYQGDEQGFSVRRRAMFKGGYASDGDAFDTGSPLYRHIQALARIRTDNKVFSRGSLEIVADSSVGAGIFVYSRIYEGKRAYVIFNTAMDEALLNGLETGFADAADVQILFQEGYSERFQFGATGKLTRPLPPKSAVVLLGDMADGHASDDTAVPKIKITNLEENYVNREEATISGTASEPNAKLVRVIDGNLGQGKEFHADAEGRWSVDLPVKMLGDHSHSVEIYAPDRAVASLRTPYRVLYEIADHEARVIDPKGDDRGPAGRYRYPLHPTFGSQIDILEVSAKASGPALQLVLKMSNVAANWAPPNGFDHASFNIYFHIPGLAGPSGTILPILRAEAPGGGTWNVAHEFQGWGNIMYSPKGSDAERRGELFGYAPAIKADREADTLTLVYDGERFGVQDWEGATIYVTSWDRDGGDGSYRGLSQDGSIWEFGGGSESDPRILDDVYLTLEKARQ